MNLADVAAHLEQDLKDRRAGGEDCFICGGDRVIETKPAGAGHSDDLAEYVPCPDCNGSGKSPAITQAEQALAAVRGEMERAERLLKPVKEMADCEPVDDQDIVVRRFCRLILLAEYNAPVPKEEVDADR